MLLFGHGLAATGWYCWREDGRDKPVWVGSNARRWRGENRIQQSVSTRLGRARSPVPARQDLALLLEPPNSDKLPAPTLVVEVGSQIGPPEARGFRVRCPEAKE